MRYATPLKRWIKKYKKVHGLTRIQMAKKIGLSATFLDRILNHYEPCPFWLIARLAKVLEKDEEVIGLSFGYYPSDWVWYSRSYPEKALEHLLKGMEDNEIYWHGEPKLLKTPAVKQLRPRPGKRAFS
jgi:transcriptional regulator with XRE-family HTH domain